MYVGAGDASRRAHVRDDSTIASNLQHRQRFRARGDWHDRVAAALEEHDELAAHATVAGVVDAGHVLEKEGLRSDVLDQVPHVPPEQFPGVALANELYLEGGIRSVEIGTLMFAKAARMDLVRLAIPRRVYTQSHIDYVVEVILEVWEHREQIGGLKLVSEAPFLRHFTAQLEPLRTSRA